MGPRGTRLLCSANFSGGSGIVGLEPTSNISLSPNSSFDFEEEVTLSRYNDGAVLMCLFVFSFSLYIQLPGPFRVSKRSDSALDQSAHGLPGVVSCSRAHLEDIGAWPEVPRGTLARSRGASVRPQGASTRYRGASARPRGVSDRCRATANPPSPASTSQGPKKPRRNNQIPFSFFEVESFKELQFCSRTRGKLELVVPRHNQRPCDCPPESWELLSLNEYYERGQVGMDNFPNLFGLTRETPFEHLLLPRRFHVDGQFTQEVAHSSLSEVAILKTDGDNPHGFYFAYNGKEPFSSSLEGCSKFQHLMYGVIEGNLSLSSPRDLELGHEVQGLACDAKRVAAETERDEARKESKKLWRDLRRLKKRKLKELEEFLVVMEKRLEADAESSRVKD
ncbi:unnamed protein product [Cochlearia groenlandica]